MVAFLSLLKSDTGAFLRTNIAKRALPDGHRMREQSMLVYQAMFNKFLEHQANNGSSFFEASPTLIGTFVSEQLKSNTKDTTWRYLRLLERVYDHLVFREYRDANPVSNWIESCINAGESPRVGKMPVATPVIDIAGVTRIQTWMYTRGSAELDRGNWRVARDLTLASVSLGTGMRCTELLMLRRQQVVHWPEGPAKDRFEFNIPGWASVATAKAHSTPADVACVELMEKWWSQRWSGFKVPSRTGQGIRVVLPAKELVFPATNGGSQLDASTLFKNLKRLAKEGVDAGVLTEQTQWVLSRGAQGLRRAYATTELQRGEEAQVVSFRMGLHRRQSVRRYREPDASISAEDDGGIA